MNTLASPHKTLVLIDGHALAYRMYFALERTNMQTSRKEPSWAVYGFFNAIFALLKEVRPDAIAVSFDVSRESFRNEIYEAYKAHRESMPDALRAQMGNIVEGVKLLGMPIYELKGYEADDVIGTLSWQALQASEAQGSWQVYIVTGDQDAFQLVDTEARVQILIPSRTPKEGLIHYTWEKVYEKWGVYPDQVVDFKALKGDPSDNIPGVPGIGDKTAGKLLAEYRTLENLYDNLEFISTAKLKEKLETYKDQAFLCQDLARIRRDAPVTLNLEACHLVIPDLHALMAFLQQMEFRTFIQQAPSLLAPFLTAQDKTETLPAMALNSFPSAKPTSVPLPSLPLFDFSNHQPSDNGAPSSLSPASSTPSLNSLETAQPMLSGFEEVFSTMSIDHTLIQDEKTLQEWIKTIQKKGVFSLDLETTGLDVFTAKPVGIAIAISEGLVVDCHVSTNPLKLQEYPKEVCSLKISSEKPAALNPKGSHSVIAAAYIPVGHTQHPELQLSVETVLKALQPLITSSNIVKIVHNAKYEINVFRQWGMPIQGPVFDTMIASYVQNPERRHGLKALGSDLIGYRMREISELIGSGKKAISFAEVPVEEGAAYGACDAYVTMALAEHFIKTFSKPQETLFYELEMPLATVLAEIEYNGVSVDTEQLQQLSQTITQQLGVIEADIYRLSGCTFNINSPKQVGEVLFEKLGIKPLKKTASKSSFSTDAKVLEQLADQHLVVQEILNYRQLFKLKSTYIDNLPTMIHPKTGRLHTSFNQTITATGRLSSSDPNLQNIPVRSEVGSSIRKAFVPQDRHGAVLLSADYSQIELRLLAHFSEDPFLVNAFNLGEDIHQATAALVFDVPLNHVTKEQRYRAKTVNFGIIYGQTAHGLSQQLNISRAEAQFFIDKYFKQFERVQSYIESIKQQAHQTGIAATIFGRERNLTEGLKSSVRSIREFSERAAFNTPLQGSAADLIKLAMIRLQNRLNTEIADHGLQTRLILQVHDEVVLEVPKNEVENVQAWVIAAMALEQPLRVPLVVDVSIGSSWLEA